MKHLLPLLLTICITADPTPTFAQAAKRAQQFNVNKERLAIKGYDPVSYFTTGTALAGDKGITETYQGITYRFATIQHKQAFIADPAKYEPQYGGWCAYAMGASGEKVDVDPKTFKIVNSKLYLFYNSFLNNTKTTWNKNETDVKSKADNNWKKIFL